MPQGHSEGLAGARQHARHKEYIPASALLQLSPQKGVSYRESIEHWQCLNYKTWFKQREDPLSGMYPFVRMGFPLDMTTTLYTSRTCSGKVYFPLRLLLTQPYTHPSPAKQAKADGKWRGQKRVSLGTSLYRGLSLAKVHLPHLDSPNPGTYRHCSILCVHKSKRYDFPISAAYRE